MKNQYYILIISLLWACQNVTEDSNLKYPETAAIETIDTYFDTKVSDPYRWLEDDKSKETGQWVAAQNKVTQAYLGNIDFRAQVKERLTELENYEKVSAPEKHGDYYYFSKNDGLQNQAVIYRVKAFDDEPELFFDPNTLSADGTTALGGWSFSKDNKYFAYATSAGGSDWREIFVLNTKDKTQLDDHLKWAKFTAISWHKDGFFYQRFDEPEEGSELKGVNTFAKVYYHKVGSDQTEDELVYQNPDNPQNRFFAQVSSDERFLFLSSSVTTSGNELFVKDLSQVDSKFIPIIRGFANDHYVVDNDGDYLIIHTTLNAPNNKLIKVHYSNPSPDHWEILVPETENVMDAVAGGGKLFGLYLVDAKTSIKQFDYNGKLEREIALPGIGRAFGFDGDKEDKELFYTFTSFTVPPTIYKYEVASGNSQVQWAPEVKFDKDSFETKQVFFESKDGTRVPMFIVSKKGIVLDGKNPTWLYAYGGFDISLTPSFNTSRIAWLENGGVFAMPNIRGGGEYGESWHKAGTKLHKKNVFEDFIAAAEYLIREKYTSSEYLALQGGSNGGLLIGATINMRPDLARVAFPMVGVMDMLRYQNFTIGRAWSVDYGTSEDSKEMFEYLYSYSPLHNIRENGNYPSVMVTTADHDDRVVPAHSFKYAATLQAKNQNSANPLLIRIETNAGHGAGMSTEKRVELSADMYSYAWYNMGIIPKFVKEGM